jgi:hypothetical protein
MLMIYAGILRLCVLCALVLCILGAVRAEPLSCLYASSPEDLLDIFCWQVNHMAAI